MSTIYNIEDTANNDTITDPAAIDAILSFSKKIDDTGVVCRGDVLALEEFIGTSVLTAHVPESGLSEIPSAIGVPQLQASLMKVKSTLQLQDALTKDDVLNLARKTLIDMKQTCNKIIYRLSNANMDTINAFLNDKYIYQYDEDDNLINVTEIDLTDLLTRYSSYFDKLITYKDEPYADTIFKTLNNRDRSLILLNLLLDTKEEFYLYEIGKISYRLITMVDIVNMLKNKDVIIARIQEIIDAVYKEIQFIEVKDDIVWDLYTNNDRSRFYKLFSKLGDIFNDQLSIQIISLVTSKFKLSEHNENTSESNMVSAVAKSDN